MQKRRSLGFILIKEDLKPSRKQIIITKFIKNDRSITMTLGKKLALYRASRGLTQQQLGEHLRVSAQAISKWENDLTTPDVNTLKELAELYRVTLDKLVDLSEDVEDMPTESAYADVRGKILCVNCGRYYEQKDIKIGGGGRAKGVCIYCFSGKRGTPEQNEAPAADSFSNPEGKPLCIECGRYVDEGDVQIGKGRKKCVCKDCYGKNMKKKLKVDDTPLNSASDTDVKKIVSAYSARSKKMQKIGNIVGAIIAIPILVLMLIATKEWDFGSSIALSLYASLSLFAFVAQLFTPGFIRGNFEDLDFDFCLEIGALGHLVDMALYAAFGLFYTVIGLICAPFVYPFTLILVARRRKKADVESISREFSNV